MSDISEQATSFIHDLGDAARRNPLSAALIGMGVAWLFSGRAAGAASEVYRRSGVDQIPDAAAAIDAANSKMKPAVESAGEMGRERIDMLSDYARSLPEHGSELLENARANLGEVFRAQPLALGAIGLAIGAGIAAALPATKLEAEYFGETSEAVKEKAEEFVSEKTELGMDAAEAAINAAAEEASRQGLTVEGAKSAARELSAKLGRVVDAAGKDMPERTS
jgi:hypothetical protein